jgi:hypothetical protein
MLFGCLADGSYAVADVTSDLRVLRVDIESVDAQLRKDLPTPASDKLDRAVSALNAIIGGQELSGAGRSVAHYYRAEARKLLNEIRVREKQPVDIVAAQAALADYDAVIARGADIPGWGVNVDNAMYIAGTVASNHLKSTQSAYSYFDKCAQRNHMGCVNVIAGVRLTGKWGQRMDVAAALDLHFMVYNTGTRYTCAGAYSAKSIALIGYFTGTKRGTEDELEWFARAYSLLDRVAAVLRVENACDRATFEIGEYLLRLSRGQRDSILLQKAIERSGNDEGSKAVVRFLRGEIGEDALSNVVAGLSINWDRCHAHFSVLWHAKINGDDALAQRHYRALLEVGGDECAMELAYVKKKYGF